MRTMATSAHLVAEPSGAVTFAAWLFHSKELPESKKTVAVVTGGNVDPQLLAQVLSEAVAGLSKQIRTADPSANDQPRCRP